MVMYGVTRHRLVHPDETVVYSEGTRERIWLCLYGILWAGGLIVYVLAMVRSNSVVDAVNENRWKAFGNLVEMAKQADTYPSNTSNQTLQVDPSGCLIVRLAADAFDSNVKPNIMFLLPMTPDRCPTCMRSVRTLVLVKDYSTVVDSAHYTDNSSFECRRLGAKVFLIDVGSKHVLASADFQGGDPGRAPTNKRHMAGETVRQFGTRVPNETLEKYIMETIRVSEAEEHFL